MDAGVTPRVEGAATLAAAWAAVGSAFAVGAGPDEVAATATLAGRSGADAATTTGSLPASGGTAGKGRTVDAGVKRVDVATGTRIGVSTGKGLGWVSNKSGKPTTPAANKTSAPTRRRRARVRAACTELSSTPALAAPLGGCARGSAEFFLLRKKGRRMRRCGQQ